MLQNKKLLWMVSVLLIYAGPNKINACPAGYQNVGTNPDGSEKCQIPRNATRNTQRPQPRIVSPAAPAADTFANQAATSASSSSNPSCQNPDAMNQCSDGTCAYGNCQSGCLASDGSCPGAAQAAYDTGVTTQATGGTACTNCPDTQCPSDSSGLCSDGTTCAYGDGCCDGSCPGTDGSCPAC